MHVKIFPFISGLRGFSCGLVIHWNIHHKSWGILALYFNNFRFSSVAQSCLILCDLMDCSTSRVYSNSCPLSRWCHPNISSSVIPSLLPSVFPRIRVFSNESVLCIRWPASVLPMNIQDWFPLEWAGWISLQFKRLSRVFSNISSPKHQFFSAQLAL